MLLHSKTHSLSRITSKLAQTTTFPIRLHCSNTWGKCRNPNQQRVFSSHGNALGNASVPQWVTGCWDMMLGVTTAVGCGWHVSVFGHLAAWPRGPSPSIHPHCPPCRVRGLQQVSAGAALLGWRGCMGMGGEVEALQRSANHCFPFRGAFSHVFCSLLI